MNQVCYLELRAFYLIHMYYREFSHIHFSGLQTYPHVPVLCLLFLAFLPFIYLRKKNQVHTFMPNSVLDTIDRATDERQVLPLRTSEEADSEQNYFLNE